MNQIKPPLPVVYVEWEDSSTTLGWRTAEQASTSHIVSVGMLAGENKHQITLTNSRDEQGYCVDQITIPRGVIRRLRRVKLN